MIIPNGHITSYTRRIGVKGDGSPLLSAEMVTAGQPILAMIGDPSPYRLQTARAEGTKLDLVARAMKGEFTRRGITAPAVGDRLTTRLNGALGAGFSGVVQRVTTSGAGGASGSPQIVTIEIGRA